MTNELWDNRGPVRLGRSPGNLNRLEESYVAMESDLDSSDGDRDALLTREIMDQGLTGLNKVYFIMNPEKLPPGIPPHCLLPLTKEEMVAAQFIITFRACNPVA